MRRALLLLVLAAPAFAQRAPIAPREIAPAPMIARGAATAFAGDRFLTVWMHSKFGRVNLLGFFSDADGNRITPASFLIAENVQIDAFPALLPLDLVARDDGYTVFWRERTQARHFIELDLDGAVQRSARVPYSAAGTDEAYAWNGTHYFAVIKRGTDTDGFEFTREGTLVQRVTLERRIIDAEVIGSNGNSFLVFTASDVGGVAVQRVDANGESERVSFLSPFGVGITATPTNDGGAMAMWQTRGLQLQTARVDADLDIGKVHDLASGRDMIPVSVARTSSGFRAVAWAGADRGYLHVYELDANGAKRSEYATAHDEVSTRITPDQAAANEHTTLVVTPEHVVAVRGGTSQSGYTALTPIAQRDPMIAATGGRFLATWFESSALTTTARAAVLDANGRTTRTSVIASDVLPFADELSWNGDAALLVMRRGRQLLGARISANATPLDSAPFVIATTTDEDPLNDLVRASVTWTGEHWLVAWITLHKRLIYTAVVEPSGGAAPARVFRIPFQPRPDHTIVAFNVKVAANEDDVLLLWEQYEIPNFCGLCFLTADRRYVVRLDDNGQPRDTPLDLGPASFTEPTPRHALESDGENFLAVIDGQAMVIRTGGDMLYADSPRTLLNLPHNASATWDGEEYVVALRYGIAGQSHLALFRLDRNGILTRSPAHIDTEASMEHAGVAAERGIDARVVFTEDAGPADTTQVSVARESEFGPLPAAPRAPTIYRELLPSNQVRISWAPQPDAEGYIIEKQFAGVWLHVATVPATTSSVTTVNTGPIRVRAINAGGSSEATTTFTPLPPRQRSARRASP